MIPKSRREQQRLVATKKVVQTDLVLLDDGGEVCGGIYDEDGGKTRLPSNSQMSVVALLLQRVHRRYGQ